MAKEIEASPRTRPIPQQQHQRSEQKQTARPPQPPPPTPPPQAPQLGDSDGVSDEDEDEVSDEDEEDEEEILSETPAFYTNRTVDSCPAPKKLKTSPTSSGNLAEREPNETPGPPENYDKRSRAAPNATTTTTKSPVLRIWTDGSALSNGTAGSNAGVGVWFGTDDARYSSDDPPLPPLLAPPPLTAEIETSRSPSLARAKPTSVPN